MNDQTQEQQVTQKLDDYLKSQGIVDNNLNLPLTPEEIVSALSATKDIQQYLTAYQGKNSGAFGFAKRMFTSLVSNILIGMLSEPLAKQQKFNNLVYKYFQQQVEKK